MKTNQKFHSRRWLSLVCLLFFTNYVLAQEFEIKGFVVNGDSTKLKTTISYLLLGSTMKEEKVEVGRKFPFKTLLQSNDSTEIIVQSKDYKYIIHSGTSIYLDSNDFNGKGVRISKGKLSVVKELLTTAKKKIKGWFDWFGGPSNEIQGAVEGTEFSIETDGENLKIDLTEGKIAINKLTRIELNEKFIEVDSVPNRELFITETTDHLSDKNRFYDKKSDVSNEKVLNTEDSITKFFKNQFIKQKRILINGGPNSRQGFKLLEQGKESLGIGMYQKALESGEINSDKFIQASLILVEGYYRNEDFKNRLAWLEAALHYIRLNDSINKIKYDHFKAVGENDFRIGYGRDRVVLKKYYAWAYTVKLKVTGCLEAPNQNPAKWLNDAKKLSDSLK